MQSRGQTAIECRVRIPPAACGVNPDLHFLPRGFPPHPSRAVCANCVAGPYDADTMETGDEHRQYELAFETSGDAGEVALACAGEVLDRITLREPRAHARTFVAAVAEICNRHSVRSIDIGALFVSIGPGSFTGLRIGVTVTKMLSFAIARSTGKEPAVVGVPTLQVIAQNALTLADAPKEVAVFIDAMRGRVFAATFRCDAADEPRRDNRDENPLAYRPFDEAREVEPAAYLASLDPRCGVMGDGVRRHRDVCVASGLRILPEELFAPRADVVYHLGRAMLRRGETTPPRMLTPLYIRVPDAEEKWQAKHGAGA